MLTRLHYVPGHTTVPAAQSVQGGARDAASENLEPWRAVRDYFGRIV